MTWLHDEPLGVAEKAAYVMLTGAFAALAVAGYRALSLSPLEGAPVEAPAESAPALGERVAYGLSDALRTVERDLFHPDRRAPLARYLLPEEDAGATLTLAGSPQGGPIRLLGTAVSGTGGGFIMCQVGREAPRVLHVGDTLGGLRLRSISRAAADFVDAGGTVVTVRLPGAPPAPGA